MCSMTILDVRTPQWGAGQSSQPVTFASDGAWNRLKATVRRLGFSASETMVEPDARVASWPLTPDDSSVPRARRLTRTRLTAWGLEGFSDVVELLVSELVTNALRHAPGPCRLTISALDGLLRCEVEDNSRELPRVSKNRLFDEGGRGLHLLDMLACCWGGARTATGKTVWFELPTAAAGATATAAA
jgi:hypothetical protein